MDYRVIYEGIGYLVEILFLQINLKVLYGLGKFIEKVKICPYWNLYVVLVIT